MKPIKMYAIYSPFNGILDYTVKPSMVLSVEALLRDRNTNWESMQSEGYKAIVVDVSVNPENP